MMAGPEESPEELEELLERILEEKRRGGSPDLAELARRHPEFAADIEEMLPALEMLERVSDRVSEDPPASAPSPPRVERSEDALEGRAPSARGPGDRTGFLSRTLERLAGRTLPFQRYQQKGEIGRGGQGAVFRVWDEDLNRTLAMKVTLGPKGKGSSSRGQRSIGRFLDEAQVTAQLDHPGIVPVHELGVDAQGGVYFTMKLVQGRDLRTIFELVQRGEEGWSRTRALNVLLKMCEAMAYAHSKGVIHRDLKPSNVMVGSFGEVYVMDWGLARILGEEDHRDIGIQRATTSEPEGGADGNPDSPLVTLEGDVLGTPAYMSPEQARGELQAIGRQSDVYSLGAMLYHLLAGHMPYVPAGEQPSNRAILARVQRGPPAPLHAQARDVPAELVAICEKAMAWQVSSRYADMAGLSDDLRAFLEHRVVSAYRTGALAELGKWIRRNRTLAAAGAVTSLALIGGLVTSLIFRARAVAQAEVSEAVVEFLTEDMIGAALPRRSGTAAYLGGLGQKTTILEAIEASEARLDGAGAAGGRFAEKPLVEARIRDGLGWVFLSMGKYASAIRHYERAYELQVRELGESNGDSLATASRLGSLYCETGQLDRAESWLTRNGELARKTHGAGWRETLAMLSMLGNVYRAQGRLAESERAYKEALQGCQASLPPGDHLTLGVLHNVALAAMDARRFDEAEALTLETLEQEERFMSGDDPNSLNTCWNLGRLYRLTGRHEEAVTQLTLTLENMRRTQHPNLLKALSELISLHGERSNPEAARPLTRELLLARAASVQAAPADPGAANEYAWALLTAYPADLRDPATALALALEANQRTNHANPGYLDTLALAYHSTGDTARALETQTRAIELLPPGESPLRKDLEARLAEYEATPSSEQPAR